MKGAGVWLLTVLTTPTFSCLRLCSWASRESSRETDSSKEVAWILFVCFCNRNLTGIYLLHS